MSSALFTKDASPDGSSRFSWLLRHALTRPMRRILCLVLVACLFTVALVRSQLGADRFDGLLRPHGQTQPHGADDVFHFSTPSSFYPVPLNPSRKSISDLCASFPRSMLQIVQPVLKIGHGDDPDKLNAQLDSVSACFQPEDLLVFSDLEDEIRDHHAVDVLAYLPDSYYNLTANPHLQNYIWQLEMKENGTLDRDVESTNKINGWIVDKFKFLPMVERAWALKPDKPFYFFYETDTYVFWDNVFRFLQNFNPDEKLYMGSPSPGRHTEDDVKTWFANGGPGFVLSRGAVRALLHRETGDNGELLDGVQDRWRQLVQDECCGDSVMGWTLYNVGVVLKGLWPMFNPHALDGLPFGQYYWCQPVFTMHKTLPQQMREVWKWEFGQRQFKKPMTYADLWRFHFDDIPASKSNWENADWDGYDPPPEAEIHNFDECRQACSNDEGCFQFNWRGKDVQKCILVRTMRYGHTRTSETLPREDKEDYAGLSEEQIAAKKKEVEELPPIQVDYTAGWMKDRIKKWAEEHKCHGPQWVRPSLTRIF